MYRAVVLDQEAVRLISAAAISNEWLSSFDLPPEASSLRRVQVDDVVYVLSSQATESSRVLIADLRTEVSFTSLADPVLAFERTMHVALAMFERGVAIPLQWHCFRDGSRLSIYAGRKKTRERIFFDQHPAGTNNLFAFAITPDIREASSVQSDDKLFERAYDGLLDALLAPPDSSPVNTQGSGIVLSLPKGTLLAGGHTLQDWYDRVLTAEQRKFVDRELDRPVRLKGAAGTGKTLAMTVKCLRDFYRLADAGAKPRFAFITHSTSSVTDIVRPMLEELDPMHRWSSEPNATLEVASLYELAQSLSKYEQKMLVPLSLDGREGREFQRLLILDAIDQCLRSTRFAKQILPACREQFRHKFFDENERDVLALELMHEFGSVLDAERIRLGLQSGDDYLSSKRERWQMMLDSREERRAVLEVHDAYCRRLEHENVLSMDQMISDLNTYLLSHEWARLRERVGYDAVFVDELHYFNRAERMVFHSLFRKVVPPSDREEREKSGRGLPLFMAYDLKQSTTEALLNGVADGGSNWIRALQAGPTDLDELTEVFRYSPQIAEVLSDLDSAFPALDLESEWAPLGVVSSATNGDVPELQIYERNVGLLDGVFAQAEREARARGGRNVAVLCVNDALFAQYLTVGRISGKFVPIEGREKLGDLKYAGKKCVFSMPDYVAGMQFDVVYLIHLDYAELGEDRENVGMRRRLISRAYLGASRAKSRLCIATSRERGGAADILRRSIDKGSVSTVDRS